MKKILNYTHHPINIINGNNNIFISRHGTARSSTTRKIVDYLNVDNISIPINETTFGNVNGLPDERDDTIIIVSGITASALKDYRNDLYMVDEPIRDNTGKIIGCRSLCTSAKYGDSIDYKELLSQIIRLLSQEQLETFISSITDDRVIKVLNKK